MNECVKNLNESEHPATDHSVNVAKNDLNYTSYDELVELRDLLSEGQRELLSFLNHRKLKKGLPYLAAFTGSIFAMIEHGGAYNLVHCGHLGKGRKGTCNEPFFCQNCARMKAKKFLEKTVTRFNRYHWFFATLSFTEPVVFGSGAMDEAERYLRVTRDTLNAAASLWSGCLYREEVAVTDFLPLSIRPHAHLLICSETPDFNSASLKQAFDDAARPHHLGATVSLDFEAIESLDAYIRTVHYIFKPIDVATPYRKAWAILGEDFSGKELHAFRRQVNNELTDLVYGVQLLRPVASDTDAECEVETLTAGDEGQRRLIYTGVLSGRSKKTIYLSKKQMALARDKIGRILRDGAKGAKRVRHPTVR